MKENNQLCPECDGEGSLPDTGKQADGFRLCECCNGKGYVSSVQTSVKIDKAKSQK